jgi:hypothetical protein
MAASTEGRRMRAVTCITIAFLIAASCSGASSDREEKKLGGCVIDTITIGTGLVRAPAPRGRAARIEILSLTPVGEERYRRAAAGLAAVLDSAGISVYSRSELLHVERGPCWPAYRITFLIDVESRGHSERIRDALGRTRIAGVAPATERPENYGFFFITCGKGDRDWWTVWYTESGEEETGNR